MQDTYHFHEIFSILRQTMNSIQMPLVSRKKWDDIKKTPFTVLISCLLSLRTKENITEQASLRLLKDNDTPEKILQLSESTIQHYIYPVGFYKTKAKRIKDISQTLISNHDGKVPNDFQELLSLKGVGRKTANIVMVYGFHNDGYLPIDTHCHRIPNRLGWIRTKTPEETEKELLNILPKQYHKDFNHLFVQFGQTICKPISPHCSICPLTNHCQKIAVGTHR
jgi:endonuclease-3